MDFKILFKPYEYEVRLWTVNKRTGEKTTNSHNEFYNVFFYGEKKLLTTDSFRFMNQEQLSLSEFNEILMGTENIREIIGHFKF